MSDYKDKTILVVVHGLFSWVAERFARDFGKVLLYIPWNSYSFPTSNIGICGTGLPNVTKVDSIFGPHLANVDLIYFGDIYFADEQVYLENQGYRVWGGRNGEEMELYRATCKEIMEGLGLPVNPWKQLKGMDALREHLKTNENQHVKIDKWRGTFETFKAESYELAEPKLNQIEHEMGAYSRVAEFIAENDLPNCSEVGTDLYCIDGQLPSASLVGIETKDVGFCGEFIEWSKLPEPVRRWNEAMAPVFAQYGYRGWLSNEIRIGEDLVPYMIDATTRQPSPPGELVSEFYLNYTDIVWNGAEGIMVDPIPAAKFGMEVIIKSDWASENWQPIEYDEKYANQIKLFNSAVIEGKRYIVPQDEKMAEIGAVVGWGDTLDEAQAHLQEAADSIKGYGIKMSHGSIDDAKKAMQDLADFGLPVFTLSKQSTSNKD